MRRHRGPLRRRAWWSVLLLVAGVPWTLAAVAADVVALLAVARAEGPDADTGLLDTSESFDEVLMWTGWPFAVPLFVAFLMWFHRAHKLAARLDLEPSPRRPAWAVASWLVPIVNLYVPLLATKDLWRAGEPGVEEDGAWSRRPVPRVISWWWAAWVACVVLSFSQAAVGLPSRPADDLGAWRLLHAMDLGAMLVSLPAVPLAVAVVRRVTARLEQLEESGGG